MNECSCSECQNACKHMPGRFLPAEAEKAAEHLGLTLKEFFDKSLGVNWWEADSEIKEDTFFLAPAITTMNPGSEYPGNPGGQCVFFKGGKCSIHAVKPFECREYQHDDPNPMIQERSKEIAKAWVDHQQQIKDLLGRDPETEEYSGGLFGGLW